LGGKTRGRTLALFRGFFFFSLVGSGPSIVIIIIIIIIRRDGDRNFSIPDLPPLGFAHTPQQQQHTQSWHARRKGPGRRTAGDEDGLMLEGGRGFAICFSSHFAPFSFSSLPFGLQNAIF